MSIMPTKPLEAVPFVTEEWRKCLLEAAERIRVRGHAKQVLVTPDGRQCALGAIFDCTYDGTAFGKENTPRKIAAAAVNKLFAHLGGQMISTWNNAPERTADEIIETMIAVALAPAPASEDSK